MPAQMTRRSAIALAMGGLASTSAFGQNAPAASSWPRKTVKLLVGFPAGSSPDVTARLLATPLSQALGQSVVVENRPGAGGNLAAGLIAHASDDHTLGVMINGNMTIARLIQPNLNFDPQKDFAPISLIGVAPLALTVPANAPGTDIPTFFAAAKTAGNRWNYGTPGVGTVAHIGMELLKGKTGLAPVHVPYPGNPQVVNALLTNEVQMALLPPAMAAAQQRAGKLRVIGVTSAGRSSLVPEYPALAEGGVKDFELEIWNALAGPRSLPAAVVARLSALVADIVRQPTVRESLFQHGWQMTGTSAEGLAKRIASDTRTLGAIITARGIKAQ